MALREVFDAEAKRHLSEAADLLPTQRDVLRDAFASMSAAAFDAAFDRNGGHAAGAGGQQF